MNRNCCFVLLGVSILFGCAKTAPPTVEPPAVEPKDFLGKSVGEVIADVPMELGKYFVIEEPPGVGRGIEGKTPAGDEIWVYVDRKDAIFSDKADWKLEQFTDRTVAGVAVKRNGRWHIAGKVIPYYHLNVSR
jgi:hypothetical protein